MPNIHVPEDEFERQDVEATYDKWAAVAADSDWLDEAACADFNISDFFQSHGGSPKLSTLMTCQRCPVKDDCLNSAAILENADDHIGKKPSTRIPGSGIYAGLTPSQRGSLWTLPKHAWPRAADELLDQNITQMSNRRARDLEAADKRKTAKADKQCFCGDPVYAEITDFCGQHLADAIRISNEGRHGSPGKSSEASKAAMVRKVRKQSSKTPAKRVTRRAPNDKPCTITGGCDTGAKYFAKGLCTTHYFRQYDKAKKGKSK
jgi:hypothetical protein